jgi:hypothetical protein
MANKKRKYVQPAAKLKRNHKVQPVNTSERAQIVSAVETKRTAVLKPSIPTEGPDVRYQNIANEIKRILITAGLVFGIMIVLYLILK